MRSLRSIRRIVPVLVAGLSLAIAGSTSAATPRHPVVVGFERFHESHSGDPARFGQLLLGELNCVSCHQPGEAYKNHVTPKQAPILDAVGNRVSPEFLRAYLSDPHAVKPGTTMPDVLTRSSPAERERQVEALVHFLASTGTSGPSLPDKASVARGETLFHQVGCVACHGSQKSDVTQRGVVAPLGDPAAKYSVGSLSDFLRDPLKVRPAGRMPHLNLDEKDARDIACYLLRDIEVRPNVRYAYYEGSWSKLPEFSAEQPKRAGEAAGLDLGLAERGDSFALRFEGYLHIRREAEYTFHLGSDDGSRLQIDGQTVVDNDGTHAFETRQKKIKLAEGPHAVVVEFFQGGGDKRLVVELEGGRRRPRQPLDGLLTLTPEERQPSRPGFQVNPELVAKGRELFAKTGCASCHQLREEGKPIASQLAAQPLSRLTGDGGCIAATAPAGLPIYSLSDAQQTALSAALASPPTTPLTPAETVARTLATFNCYACHVRDKTGGVQDAHNPHFTGTIQEMGDEGRIPPHLDGVGDKLQAAWIRHVLDNGTKDRPYMHTRMPKFGRENTEHLAAAFEQLDAQTAAPQPELADAAHRMKSSGRFLVGDQALSCIKCHIFGPHKATGIQAIDLTTMTRRLRQDWFHRYMVNPQTYRSGTRMPSAWPNGKSVVPAVLDGKTDQQLAAIWLYLADEQKAGIPQGLIAQSIELKPGKEPIIYRNFIEGLSPRGIAVGYPERANLAFDAETLSLRLIWHGAFIDAAKHWNGRGPGFQPPLGDHVLRLVNGQPFSELPDENAPWPGQSAAEAGYTFDGYRLDAARQPTFLYSRGSLHVEDFPEPVAGQRDPALRRTLTVTADGTTPERLWLRAASGTSIEQIADGKFRIDDALTISVHGSGTAPPRVRQQSGTMELLVPVTFNANRGSIELTYLW